MGVASLTKRAQPSAYPRTCRASAPCRRARPGSKGCCWRRPRQGSAQEAQSMDAAWGPCAGPLGNARRAQKGIAFRSRQSQDHGGPPGPAWAAQPRRPRHRPPPWFGVSKSEIGMQPLVSSTGVPPPVGFRPLLALALLVEDDHDPARLGTTRCTTLPHIGKAAPTEWHPRAAVLEHDGQERTRAHRPGRLRFRDPMA